ncbi:TIGR03086 family metal-binding protein [Kitasatospora sp. McL0602]|uniref:TIGR03086 family metal-binding protein n=1 Tax=Kitasatospora sp. McL0602 TaxID=3439530 RepID=UPI003F89972E
MTDIREFDRRALKITESIVNQVEVGQLGRPSPCAGWDLGRLLAHMVGQNRGFAASALGETSDLGVWADRPVGDDPAAEFAASAAAVTAAFGADGLLDRGLWLPEIRSDRLFPAGLAVGFHFIDYVVHGWDVAATIGVPAEFDADLLDAALPIAEQVPDGANRLREGASFRPGLAATGGGGTLDRILRVLGRSPHWPN